MAAASVTGRAHRQRVMGVLDDLTRVRGDGFSVRSACARISLQGAQRQGIKEHVKVKKKYDALGVGAVSVQHGITLHVMADCNSAFCLCVTHVSRPGLDAVVVHMIPQGLCILVTLKTPEYIRVRACEHCLDCASWFIPWRGISPTSPSAGLRWCLSKSAWTHRRPLPKLRLEVKASSFP
jgi:hypothetical protein